MAIQLGPNNGLMDRGARGEEHYDQVMRFYRAMDMLVQGRVKSRITELPGSPVNGDAYIFLGEGANMNALIRYSSALATWEIFPASNGWEVTVMDELDENGQFKAYFYQQSTSSWVARLAAGGLTVEAGDERYDMKRKNNLTATTDPTVDDDSTEDYEPLSRWINTATGEIFLCVSNAAGAASWQKATLTLDELGSAALSNVGNTGTNLPTATQVQAMIAAFQNFGPSSTASPGTKGFVPAPPATEVRRYLASDGTWQLITIADVPPPQGENVGTGAAGVFRTVVDNTLQFRRLYSSDGSVAITEEEGRINLQASGGSGGGLITEVEEIGDSGRVATFDEGTLTLKGIKAGANVSISETGGNLVISATGGGGGEGGNTIALDVEAFMIIYNAAEFTEEVVPFSEAASRGITASFTAIPEEETPEPSYAVMTFEVDPSTLGGLKIAGYELRFQKPDYLNSLNMWQEGETPVFEDPTIVFDSRSINLYQEGWTYAHAFTPFSPPALRLTSSNRSLNLSQISVGVTLYGGIDGSASPVGRTVPVNDPSPYRGPYGSVQVMSQGAVTDWGIDAGYMYEQINYPAAEDVFQNSFPPGPLSAMARVPDIWPGYFRTEKIVSGYVEPPSLGYQVRRTFFLGSGDQYGPWSYFQPAVTWVGVESQGETGSVVTISGATSSLVDGSLMTPKALVVNNRSPEVDGGGEIIGYSSQVFVSTDAGDTFSEIDFPSLTSSDVKLVIGYPRISGVESILYEKSTGGYDVAQAYMDNPFNLELTDLQPMSIAYPGTTITCWLAGLNQLGVCDGVQVHRYDGGVWDTMGRIITVDEEADGLRCVKIVGDTEGAWVAILSDGRYKFVEEVLGSEYVWSEAKAVVRDGVQYELVDGQLSGYDDFLGAVKYPQAEGDSSAPIIRPWRTYGLRYGDTGSGETETWPAEVRAWAPVVLPTDEHYTSVAFGFVSVWTPPISVGGPPNSQGYPVTAVSTGAYGEGDQYGYFFSQTALQGWFYVPEYPVPYGYKAITRTF